MHPRYGRRLPLTTLQGLRLGRASYLMPTVTIVLAMLIHGVNGPRAIPFFISEADHPGVQDAVFTIGLTVSGFVQMAYAWHLYHSLEVERPRLWFVATLTGMLAATNTVLVSMYDMYDFINPHILTALLAFGGGLLWAFLAGHALGSMATSDGRRWRNAGFAMAAIGFLVLGSLALSFAGILAGVWANKFDEMAAITNFVIQPLAFLSGTFYSVDRLPPPFDLVATLNPVFYAIDGFRFGLIGVADRPVVTGLLVLVLVNLVLGALCYRVLASGFRLKS